MNNNVLSIICCIAVLCMNSNVLSAHAYTALNIADILNGKNNQSYNPIRPTDGSDVCYSLSDWVEGFAVTCDCAEELIGKQLAGKTVVADKITVKGDEALLMPITTFAEKCESELLGDYPENTYVLRIAGNTDTDFISAVIADDRLTIQGAVAAHWKQVMHYDNAPATLYLKAADGSEIDADALDSEEYRHLRYYYDNFWTVQDEGMTLSEAEALCLKLEARSDIQFAWLSGIRNSDWDAKDIQSIEIAEITPGDADTNGTVDLADALTALQAYSDAELMNQPNSLKTWQLIAADMDGDGKVTIGDALTILQIYTDETLFNQQEK